MRLCVVTIFAFALIAGEKKPDPRLATPMGAAKTFFQAMFDNDVEAAKSCVLSGADQEQLIEATTRMMHSMRGATEAAYKRFGEEFRKIIGPTLDATRIDPKLFDEARETIDGDMALIGLKNGMMLRLVHTEMGWKINYVKSIAAAEPLSEGEMVIVMSKMFIAMARAAEEMKAEYEAGKYSGAEPAMLALGARMKAAMAEAREQAVKELKKR